MFDRRCLAQFQYYPLTAPVGIHPWMGGGKPGHTLQARLRFPWLFCTLRVALAYRFPS